MNSGQIVTNWSSIRSVEARELAIKAFTQLGPIRSGRVVLMADLHCGENGGVRFLDDVESYLTNPDLWRRKQMARLAPDQDNLFTAGATQ